MRDSTPHTDLALRKEITLRHALALYVSSVLGSGVLVLPGLAAQIAGPSSLIAWVLLSIASYPFAYTFASLSSRSPQSGGVYSFAKESFGMPWATATGWHFILWFITGGPAVTLIAASYLAYAFPLGRAGVYLVACCVMLAAFMVNYRGIVFSSRVQLAVVVSIIALLVSAVILSSGSIRAQNFAPFFPRGLFSVGTAAALIFWSYLGYENVSNVAEEFRNPERDFRRSVVLSVFVIGGLYCAVAFVTVGTLAYKAGGSVAPFAAIFSSVLGNYGAAGTAILAVIIIFGTENAYTTGMSRVVYAVAGDGGLPRTLYHLDPRRGIPARSLGMLAGMSILMLFLYYIFDVDLETALLVPSGAAILVYVIGSAAGVRLLRNPRSKNTLAWISLGISVAVLPFVGILVLPAIATAVAGLVYSRMRERRYQVGLNR